MNPKNEPVKGRPLKSHILRSIENVPPMPRIVHKARVLADDPDSTIKDLADLIETDPSLTVDVLRLANSAYYRRFKAVSTVQDAAMILGQKTLAEVITMACASRLLSGKLNGYSFTSGSLWKHSLAVAVGSRLIAERRFEKMAADAFTAGLIHDSGKIILDEYVAGRKVLFDAYLEDHDVPFLEAERRILGFDHAEIAAVVCKNWRFPAAIVKGVRYHHNPGSFFGNELSYMLNLADQLTAWIGFATDGILVDTGDDAMTKLGLTFNDLEPLLEEMIESVERVVSEVES